jgi:hypothetical protein
VYVLLDRLERKGFIDVHRTDVNGAYPGMQRPHYIHLHWSFSIQAWLGVSSNRLSRAFADFDGLHLRCFPRRAQILSESTASTNPPLGHLATLFQTFAMLVP